MDITTAPGTIILKRDEAAAAAYEALGRALKLALLLGDMDPADSAYPGASLAYDLALDETRFQSKKFRHLDRAIQAARTYPCCDHCSDQSSRWCQLGHRAACYYGCGENPGDE